MSAYNLNDLPPVLREMLESGQFRDSSGSLQPLHSNISAAEALALYTLVRQLRPRATAEIGFALGVSGLAILGALEANGGDSTHYVCDPQQTSLVANQGLEHVRRAGLAHRLRFFEKFPEEVFPSLPPLQFAFIDASHLFDLTLLDFILVDKRLETGGIVGFHDLWMPSLQKVVRYILSNRSYRVHPALPPDSKTPDHPAAAPLPSPRQRLSSSVKRLLRALPRADRLLAPEILQPWSDFHLPNMVFLEKTAPDTRDWRHHAAF
jgi:predicted O-methyltransferase YrrM